MIEKLRAGIVGYGYMGEIRRRTIERQPILNLVGIADPRRSSRDVADVPMYGSYEELVKEGLDVLFVCTPNVVTPEAIVYGLQHGCHVFAEKPPGRNLADIHRIRAAERRHPDLRLLFGFNHRYHPAVQDAKALVQSGSLGRILWARGVYGKSGGKGFEESWRNDPAVSGGGILLDQGIHMLDLLRYFCGELELLGSAIATTHWKVPVEDNAFLLLRNQMGAVAQLHSSATLWKHTFDLELGLERGYVKMQGLLSKTSSYGRETLVVGRRSENGPESAVGNPREELTYYDTDPSWDVQVQYLVDSILHGRPVADSTSGDAVRAMEIINQVYLDNRAPYAVRPAPVVQEVVRS